MQSFQIIKPVPVLSPYIRHYWILQDDAAVPVSERTLPIGCMQLVFHKGKQLFLQNDLKLQPQSFICGQSIGFSDVLSTGRIEMITVVFQPYAAKALLHIPVHLFHGKDVATVSYTHLDVYKRQALCGFSGQLDRLHDRAGDGGLYAVAGAVAHGPDVFNVFRRLRRLYGRRPQMLALYHYH